MPVVRLGNPAALDGGRVLEGPQVTEVTIPDNYTPAQAIATVTAVDGVWRNHSGASAPVWVESDDDELAVAIGTYYGCPVGSPDAGEGE